MSKVIVLLSSVLVFGICDVTSAHSSRKAQENLVQKLFHLTAADQVQEDVPFQTLPFLQWHKQKGVYSSGVKLNFHGRLEMAEARRLMEVFDNNMFVTAWVTSSLLEAHRYGDAPRPSDNQLAIALNAFANHKDLNKPYNTSVMTFWPMVYNATTKFWSNTPANLLGAFGILDEAPVALLEDILRLLGLGDLADEIERIKGEEYIYLQAFHIPPDFDDTFVNLGLGSLLHEVKDQFPSAWNLWKSHNTNVTSVFDALKKYAYRPFSSDPEVNTIDPRTYFYMRGFLDQAQAQGSDLALVPTWIQNNKEVRKEFYLGSAMPFNVNNVDMTVSANTVYGITASIFSGLVPPQVLDDPLIAQIYLNTSSAIAYEINHNLTSRPDLALTYYPSQIEFDWFVARTVAIMETAKINGQLPVQVMEQVYQTLIAVSMGTMTQFILSQARSDPKFPEHIYFDDFLGDGDLTLDGRPEVRGEDRIFTTAMAANALIYTWTIHDKSTGKARWRKDVPAKVVDTVTGCVTWLTENTLSGKYDPWNVFFSGSVKTFTTFPTSYPGNRFEFLNGTAIKDWSKMPSGASFLYGVQGYIPPDEYKSLLQEKHFGIMTPMVFNGYNTGDGGFPFWSSAPYTYTTTLLAISRYNNIVG